MGGRGPRDAASRPTQASVVHRGGKSSIRTAWIARGPAAMARIASGRRALHWSPTAEEPTRPRQATVGHPVGAVVDHARCRVPLRYPLEPFPFPPEVDARRGWVPLQIAAIDAEGEAARVVTPDELRLSLAGQHECDAWHLQPIEGAQLRQLGEIRPARRRMMTSGRPFQCGRRYRGGGPSGSGPVATGIPLPTQSLNEPG